MEYILSPCDGEIIKSEKINDETFSKEMLGPCFGVDPSSNNIYAPINGKIMVAEKHAVAIKSEVNGIEIIIHCGINTVEISEEISKKIFIQKHSVGDIVKQGELLLVIDVDKIKKLNFDPVVVVIVTRESIKGKDVKLITEGNKLAKDKIMSIS